MEPNPYAPPVGDPIAQPQADAGELSVLTRVLQAVLLGVILMLAGLMFLGVSVKAVEAGGLGGLWANLDQENPSRGGFAGAAWVYMLSLYWGPVAGIWSLANIVGLLLNARWAFKSLVVFWVVNLLTCLCAPIGLIGLIHILIARRAPAAVPPNDPSLPWQQPRY